jgi:hypothetical protein
LKMEVASFSKTLIGIYNPMYQLFYGQQVKPHPTKSPDFYPEPLPQ